MADRSGMEWTESTWNPTTGCDRVSPGCDNCYALTLAKRLKAMGSEKCQQDGSRWSLNGRQGERDPAHAAKLSIYDRFAAMMYDHGYVHTACDRRPT